MAVENEAPRLIDAASHTQDVAADLAERAARLAHGLESCEAAAVVFAILSVQAELRAASLLYAAEQTSSLYPRVVEALGKMGAA